MNPSRTSRPFVQRLWGAIGSLNLNAVALSFSRGPKIAKEYIIYNYRLRSGYALPWIWSNLPWRDDLHVPQVPVQELFPEIDFDSSPELIYPLPREHSVQPHELMILNKVLQSLDTNLAFEFGTAEGRTTVNLARHVTENGQVVTVNLPPEPGKSEVGYLYWNHPLKSKIKQLYADVGVWDPSEYRASAGLAFGDACDQLPGVAQEMAQVFAVVKPGGVVFRHDYGFAEGVTKFWNLVAKELPVRHIEGTTLLCLKVETPELHQKMQDVAARFLKQSS